MGGHRELPSNIPILEPREEIPFLKRLGCTGYWDLERDKGSRHINLMGYPDLEASVSGAIPQSLGRYFDKIDDRVVVADSNLLDGDQISVECFFRHVGAANFPNIVTKYNAAGNQAQYGMQGSQFIGWTAAGLTYLNTGVSTTNYFDGKWQHRVGTLNDGTLGCLYVNGKLEASSNVVVNVPWNTAGTGDLWIGGRADGAAYFGGVIGIVRVYQRALLASEVLQLFNIYGCRYGIKYRGAAV